MPTRVPHNRLFNAKQCHEEAGLRSFPWPQDLHRDTQGAILVNVMRDLRGLAWLQESLGHAHAPNLERLF